MLRATLALLSFLGVAASVLAWTPLASAQQPDADEIRERHEKFRKLFGEGMEELQAKKLDEAIEKFKRCYELMPGIPASAYNVACGYSLKNNQIEALRWLAVAINGGFYDFGHIERDRDLDNVRSSPAYRPLIESTKAAIDSQIVTVTYAPPKLNKTKKVPLVIALHGYGDTAESFLDNWKGLADSRGLIVTVPQGTLKVTKQGGYAYAAELAKRGVLKAYREALRAHNIDRTRVYIAGFSQGGELARRTALASPHLFAGVIAVSVDFERDIWIAERLRDLQLERGHVLDLYAIHGEYAIDSLLGAKRAVRDHRDAGFESKLERFQGSLGWPREKTAALEAAIDWCDEQAKARAAKVPAQPPPADTDDF
jgi:pimeloyl-ACP methyl ester carboxylesterase